MTQKLQCLRSSRHSSLQATRYQALILPPARASRAIPHVVARASSSIASSKYKNDLSDLMKTLEEDSVNLFSEQGMDLSIYADEIDFRDPITKYPDIDGFVKNLKFLKNSFDPTYDMLDIRQVNETDVEARWTMGFDVLPIKNSPLGKLWQPHLTFTGTTIYGTNAETGKIERHIDTWDCIKKQEYFSPEGFGNVLQQIFNFQRTPQLETPNFKTLKRKREYSIREYEPFAVAEAPNGDGSESANGTGSGPFKQLANFLFGGNDEERKMAMTTPVITSDSGVMQFVLPLSDVAEAPSPLPDSPVRVKMEEGGLYAAVQFSGKADQAQARQKRDELLQVMQRDGLQASDGFLLLRYNDPSVKAPFRRNEVLIKIDSGFDLWET